MIMNINFGIEIANKLWYRITQIREMLIELETLHFINH